MRRDRDENQIDGMPKYQLRVSGSLCRTDRVCKYNQLLRIEDELGDVSVAGQRFSTTSVSFGSKTTVVPSGVFRWQPETSCVKDQAGAITLRPVLLAGCFRKAAKVA
jgi:hypothetical protein